MRVTSRARIGVALVAATTVLAGCGSYDASSPAATSGGASGGAAGGSVVSGDGSAGTGSDGRSKAATSGSGSDHGRPAAKPPRGAYDDTTGTRTGKPRGQEAVFAHLPGPARSTCVTVGSRSVVRSGPVGMGSFSSARSAFAKAKTPYNAAPSFFYVIPHSRTASNVTVVATRPGTRVAPVRVHSRHLESAAQWRYFPVNIQIPTRGTWRFQVTVDGARGCFVASFA